MDFVNRAVRQGTSMPQAVLAGGQSRFRAIMLTTITTVAGLMPILLEKSFQAQFLIPMAISISFGLMGATFLVLLLVPALYLILIDVRRVLYWLWNDTWVLPDEQPGERLTTVEDVTQTPTPPDVTTRFADR